MQVIELVLGNLNLEFSICLQMAYHIEQQHNNE